jgi:alkylation response protein AidB-like acyl-CoA dehydrogenase
VAQRTKDASVTEWTDTSSALRDGLARWLDALNTTSTGHDGTSAFPWDRWKLVKDCGLLRLPFESRWGGLGADLRTTMHVLEKLGEGCRDGGLSFSVATHVASTGVPLQRFGSTRLKEVYLPKICAGDAIGAHAITEPDSGSDALNMHTTAVRDKDHFVLNGNKTFISNGPVADIFVVYARTHPAGGSLGITAFLVERGTPGFDVGDPVAKMGLHSSPLSDLYFDGCRVPADNVVGRVGWGYRVLHHVMKREILYSFAISAGAMRHRLDRCVDYANTRRQFGKNIGSYQAVAHKIVEMKIGLETSRMWLYAAAEKVMTGVESTMDIAIAKLVTSENNTASALAAIQVFGGYGYLAEYGLEQELRDAVAGTVYSGTSEIQRNRIASMLGM